jgi:hypothetical protein
MIHWGWKQPPEKTTLGLTCRTCIGHDAHVQIRAVQPLKRTVHGLHDPLLGCKSWLHV